MNVKRQQLPDAMAYDEKKIEVPVLALLYYGSFERPGSRCAWKTSIGESPSAFLSRA